MPYRMTVKHVEYKIAIVNGYLGFVSTEEVYYNTIGALCLDSAYGGYAVQRVCNEHGGVSQLTEGHVTLRECANFLSGMIAALRISEERERNIVRNMS